METKKKGRPAGLPRRVPTNEEMLQDIKTRPTVPVWPHCGFAFNLGRGATYAAARRQEIETVDVGRAKRAITAPLRKRLGIEA